MSFEDWKEEAANYLEAAGIAYFSALDDQLFALWSKGVKTDKVPDLLNRTLANASDFVPGMLVSWEWQPKGVGQLAIEQGLRAVGRVVDRSVLPHMARSVGIQVLDNPAWVIDPVFALSKGRTFSKVENEPNLTTAGAIHEKG